MSICKQAASTKRDGSREREKCIYVSLDEKAMEETREINVSRDERAEKVRFIVSRDEKRAEEVRNRCCAADFSLLNLPKGKSLGRSKPATNS